MKVAFVLPRYGTEIIGGAETAARLFAEHLAAAGDEVEVITTCASDFVTWEDDYPAGTTALNGVRVRRFPSESGRDPEFHPLSARLLEDPSAATLAEARDWLELQGPRSSGLVEAALGSDADVEVFYPYLYHPTVGVIGEVPMPAVMHPAAHDEPALRLPIFPPVFAAADGLVFQTAAERALVESLFPVAAVPQLLLGLGVDEPSGHPLGGEPSLRPDGPYLLCLGRVDAHKGSRQLAEVFRATRAAGRGEVRLVFAGPVVEPLEEPEGVLVLGPVSEAQKWDLLAGALAVVSPSRFEAFSLVVAEAWSAGRPVLVNAACAATAEHCRRSGGGVPIRGAGHFAATVDRLLADPGFTRALGSAGLGYADRHFRWPTVIRRYRRFLESVVDRDRRHGTRHRSS